MLVDTPVCDFGWRMPEFSLETPEGRIVTSESAMGTAGLLVAFICNHCPYVKRIASQLASDCNHLQTQGIGVTAIMSNDFESYTDDAPDKMKEFAAAHHFGFPYLVDPNQSVARSFGAVCTPDFFGFNSRGELQYRGRFNSSTGARGKNPVSELREAMLLVKATGQGPQQQSPSMGCSIKWRNNHPG